MSSVHRSLVVVAAAILLLIADAQPATAQGRGGFRFGGGSSNSDNDNNNNNNSNSNNNQNNNRRNQDDDDSVQIGGIRIGGSDAKKVQDAIDGYQGNQGQGNQQFRRNQGQNYNSQQWQNFPGNDQGNFQNQNFKNKNWGNRQNWTVHFGGSAPFSGDWYNDHPNAWHHHHNHDHDDAWKIATAAGVLGWLGWQAHPNTTVIYQPVPVETYYVEGQPVIVDGAPGDWMPLGVYSLMTGPTDDGTRLLQLSVDKHGHIGGNYFDSISNLSQSLTGRVNEQTQQVQWSLDSNRQMVFFTPLSQLTQSQGIVYVRFPSGQQQKWTLLRMADVQN